ncbi:Uma2 family endonuclease [Streptomyces sp. B1866]|uniref:Uma2 family endonuclease n=1 Tax=Streptomyces sp. B1866 TaxID=3075431 RepID=UPI0028910DEE|nr:Uma2 family endonuclease [Streptomyces sp. B1866]MDT3396252.1 Uma2 family endonuclease [Streptomyces sp. B1866]
MTAEPVDWMYPEESAMATEPVDWMHPPPEGWTYEQVKDLDLPFDWELVDGVIVVRDMTVYWHNRVRDELYVALRSARHAPCEVTTEQCILIDQYNPARPDVVVFDRTDLDFFSLECLPVASVLLAVEVVSHGSRTDDRFRKPGMYAAAGIPYFWRVERGEDNIPVVHEFRLDEETGRYTAAPDVPIHTGVLRTDVPFPVELDLAGIFKE